MKSLIKIGLVSLALCSTAQAAQTFLWDFESDTPNVVPPGGDSVPWYWPGTTSGTGSSRRVAGVGIGGSTALDISLSGFSEVTFDKRNETTGAIEWAPVTEGAFEFDWYVGTSFAAGGGMLFQLTGKAHNAPEVDNLAIDSNDGVNIKLHSPSELRLNISHTNGAVNNALNLNNGSAFQGWYHVVAKFQKATTPNMYIRVDRIDSSGNTITTGTPATRNVDLGTMRLQDGTTPLATLHQLLIGNDTSTNWAGRSIYIDNFRVWNDYAMTSAASNTAPTISDVANQSVAYETATGALAVTVGDGETAAGSLTLTGASSNTTLVPNASIVFGGSGASRTVTVTPAAGQSGTATITLTVSDGELTAQDTFTVTVSPPSTPIDIVNYKTGIDAAVQGPQGEQFDVEQLYFNPLHNDSKVIYVRSTAQISLKHNARNIAGNVQNTTLWRTIGINGLDGSADSGDEGVIRYYWDRDLLLDSVEWAAHDGVSANVAAYSAPFTLASQTYPGTATNVVGTTGGVGGSSFDLAGRGTYYWRGMLDSVGDEWHELKFADDDAAFVTTSISTSITDEFYASDGSTLLFVVDPKTPILKPSVTGTGQFYTTPAKKYFVPIIYDQTTYIAAGTAGTVSITLHDINGNNVFYRINSSGSFIDGGSDTVVLDQDDFTDGANTLDYYYAGNAAYTKTRIVYKNPTWPSAIESHGNRLWGDAAGWTRIQSKIANTYGNVSFPTAVNLLRTNDSRNRINSVKNLGQGFRWTMASNGSRCVWPLPNAVMAKIDGIAAKDSDQPETYAYYAKLSLLDNPRSVSPLGHELSHTGVPIPSRELHYRGYYEARPIMESAMAYDILIDIYRSDDHANGITPIEDYHIRDSLASQVHEALMWGADWSGVTRIGMWDTARRLAALQVAMMMPAYDTAYYGVSGYDGTSTESNQWNPFPAQTLTWRQALATTATTRPGFPNLRYRLGIEWYSPDSGTIGLDAASEGLCLPAANAPELWFDRLAYWPALMGPIIATTQYIANIHEPTLSWANFKGVLAASFAGTLESYNFDTDPEPSQAAMMQAVNAANPELATAANLALITQTSANNDPAGAILFFDPEPVVPVTQVQPVTFSPAAGTYASTQSVTLSSATAGASIRYNTGTTLAGTTDPTSASGTVYSTPISVASSQFIKAIAYNGVDTDSVVTAAEYIIAALGQVPTPVLVLPEVNSIGGISWTITQSDGSAATYYRLDGTTPTASDTLYSGVVSTTTKGQYTLVARSFRASYDSSDVAQAVFRVNDFDSTGGQYLVVPIGTRTTPFRVTLNATPSHATMDGIVGFADNWDEVGSTLSNLAVNIRFGTSGNIDARNGTAYAAEATAAYSAASQYAVAFDIDPANRLYDCTVGATVIANDYAFREAGATSIGYLVIWSSSTTTGTVNVQDVAFGDYQTPPPVTVTPRTVRQRNKSRQSATPFVP